MIALTVDQSSILAENRLGHSKYSTIVQYLTTSPCTGPLDPFAGRKGTLLSQDPDAKGHPLEDPKLEFSSKTAVTPPDTLHCARLWGK